MYKWTKITNKADFEAYAQENIGRPDSIIGDSIPETYPFWIRSTEVSGRGTDYYIFNMVITFEDILNLMANL